jgi:hypothetical protein
MTCSPLWRHAQAMHPALSKECLYKGEGITDGPNSPTSRPYHLTRGARLTTEARAERRPSPSPRAPNQTAVFMRLSYQHNSDRILNESARYEPHHSTHSSNCPLRRRRVLLRWTIRWRWVRFGAAHHLDCNAAPMTNATQRWHWIQLAPARVSRGWRYREHPDLRIVLATG